MVKVKNADRIERDLIEEAQALLLTAAIDLDEVALRVQQARRRTRLVEDTLEPAAKRLERIREDLRLARHDLSQAWEEGQSKKWKGANDGR